MTRLIQINPRDNVAIVVDKLDVGETVEINEKRIIAQGEIILGQKVAIDAIQAGQEIIKYGFPIGIAKTDIKPGAWVHTHNIESTLGEEANYEDRKRKNLPLFPLDPILEDHFPGYLRSDGKVGIRNDIWILSTVSSTNQIAAMIAKRAQEEWANAPKKGAVDGIYAFRSPWSCSALETGDDNMHELISSLAKNPNAAGVLILGLGCEKNNVDTLKKVIDIYDPERVKFLSVQNVQDEVEKGVQLIHQLLERASQMEREPVPLSKLQIGLLGDGAQGFTGITANPLLGMLSDTLITVGGSVVLTGFPDFFGAEQMLLDRTKDQTVYQKLFEQFEIFQSLFANRELPLYEEPSPGDKAGGISTLEDKAVASIQKGGYSQIVDVLEYGEVLEEKGLNLLACTDAPLPAATALTAAGCQLIIGAAHQSVPIGSAVPMLKVAADSKNYQYKEQWFDFDAGSRVDGTSSQELAEQLLQLVLAVAGGETLAKNEIEGFKELGYWKPGLNI